MACGGERTWFTAILASACRLAMILLPDPGPIIVLGRSILISLESATAESRTIVPSAYGECQFVSSPFSGGELSPETKTEASGAGDYVEIDTKVDKMVSLTCRAASLSFSSRCSDPIGRWPWRLEIEQASLEQG